MHQTENRKYQLFPKGGPAAPGKGLDPEQAFALAMGQAQKAEKTEKTTASTGLRLRIKEHNLNRRRKVSVPELGPMTTVQEVAMDSRRRRPIEAPKASTDLGSNDSRTTTSTRAVNQRSRQQLALTLPGRVNDMRQWHHA